MNPDYMRGLAVGIAIGKKQGKPTPPTPTTTGWMLPLPDYKLNCVYEPEYQAYGNLWGCRQNPVTGIYTFHYGIDVQAPNGTNLYAVEGGTVTQSGDNGGWGISITVQTQAFSFMYAHRPDTGGMSVGDIVTKGQVIGQIGNTGQSQGGHVHVEIILPDGTKVDPMTVLPATLETCTVIPVPQNPTIC